MSSNQSQSQNQAGGHDGNNNARRSSRHATQAQLYEQQLAAQGTPMNLQAHGGVYTTPETFRGDQPHGGATLNNMYMQWGQQYDPQAQAYAQQGYAPPPSMTTGQFVQQQGLPGGQAYNYQMPSSHHGQAATMGHSYYGSGSQSHPPGTTGGGSSSRSVIPNVPVVPTMDTLSSARRAGRESSPDFITNPPVVPSMGGGSSTRHAATATGQQHGDRTGHATSRDPHHGRISQAQSQGAFGGHHVQSTGTGYHQHYGTVVQEPADASASSSSSRQATRESSRHGSRGTTTHSASTSRSQSQFVHVNFPSQQGQAPIEAPIGPSSSTTEASSSKRKSKNRAPCYRCKRAQTGCERLAENPALCARCQKMGYAACDDQNPVSKNKKGGPGPSASGSSTTTAQA